MKKLIIVIILISLTGCLDKKAVNYQELEDIRHIKNNKDNIESVIITKITIGSHDCYKVDIDKAYNAISNLKILKQSNISVTDDYMWYTFYYKDGTKTSLSFEGPYLVDNSKNNTEYTSYTIDFEELDLLENDLVECK